MRLGLTGRILIGGAILAAVFAAQFVFISRSFNGIRSDTREQRRAEQAIVSATRLEKLVLDLETGTRGYVITGDRRFLQPWTSAQRALPGESARLETFAPGPWSAEVGRLWRAYLNEYSKPLVREVQ